MPEELAVQMPILKELLDAMGIRRYELEGYEADDILGTAARICEEKGWNCVIVTGDKDSLQLVSESTSVCNVKTRMGQTETILYTPQVFREEYGFDPPKMVDLKALMGDSSDNIPGVPGIGEKTALDLLHRYGSLDGIYRDLDALDVKPGVLKKLREGEESARLSFWLATILREVPLPFDPEENRWDKDYTSALYPMMQRLGFLKFIERWGLEPARKSSWREESESLPRDGAGRSGRSCPRWQGCRGARLRSFPWTGWTGWSSVTVRPYGPPPGPPAARATISCCVRCFPPEIPKIAHDLKDLMGLLLKEKLPLGGLCV